MLSVFASKGSIVEETNLKKWFAYIIQKKSKMAIDTAAVVYENGNIAAATQNFNITKDDFLAMKRVFVSPEEEKIAFNEVTYCLKSRNPAQLVCFNGQKYLIISRTHHTFIIAQCRTRQSSALVAGWLHKVAGKLRERNT